MTDLHLHVITLFPEMFDAIKHSGITRRAIEREHLKLSFYNPRDFTQDKHRTVDAPPYGGGPGMVMLYQPIVDAIAAAKAACGQDTKVIYLSPQGQRYDHAYATRLMGIQHLILLCGRYEGIDERIIVSHVDEEVSIGDYVLTGGELPAMVLADSLTRFIPGVLGDSESAQQDSFVDGLLDYPHYAKPRQIDGLSADAASVPEVLLSGNHRAIDQWRTEQSIARTKQRRPDLLQS